MRNRNLADLAVYAAVAVGTVVVANAIAGGATTPKLDLPRISGVYNPAVTQSTINKTICVPGWTKTVRPPQSYTYKLKVQQIKQYGYKDTSTSSYEEDHFIPLELGGAPRDPNNLWPEPHTTSRTSDNLENALRVKVCFGNITLAAGRKQIADWKHTHG